MEIAITGANGFIGSYMIKHLRDLGHHVRGISLYSGRVHDIEIDAVDCCSMEVLESYFADKSVEAMIHAAAIIPSDWWSEESRQSLHQNLQMTMNMLEIARRRGSRFLYISSISVYLTPAVLPVTEDSPIRPLGYYTLGKLFGEMACQQYWEGFGLPVCILRVAAPYGYGAARETVVGKFIRQALTSGGITVYGAGSRSQDFVYVRDICNAAALAINGRVNGVFNVSSGVETSMRALAETVLREVSGTKSKIVSLATADPQENYHMAVSYDKARDTFGYEPRYSLAEGIREFVRDIHIGKQW